MTRTSRMIPDMHIAVRSQSGGGKSIWTAPIAQPETPPLQAGAYKAVSNRWGRGQSLGKVTFGSSWKREEELPETALEKSLS